MEKFAYPLLLIVLLFAAVVRSTSNVTAITISNLRDHGIDDVPLEIDARTGLFYPPYYSDVNKGDDSLDLYVRNLITYSDWADKYCKMNFFLDSPYIFTAHYWKQNYCSVYATDRQLKSVCCGDTTCSCQAQLRFRCWCYDD